MKAKNLHVVGGHSNPNRFKTPTVHCRNWLQETLDFGADVTLVEHVIGQTPFEFDPTDPIFRHVRLVQVRGTAANLLWLQHAMYNKGIACLPDEAFQADHGICWQDTDITHQRKSWVTDTLHMLQQWRVGQTWTHSIDFDPEMNVALNDWGNEVDRSFCRAWLDGDVDSGGGPYAPPVCRALLPPKEKKDWRSHTGYSWAIRGSTLQRFGKLVDWLITGSADYHMAHAFVGTLHAKIDADRQAGKVEKYSAGYYRWMTRLADQGRRVIEHDVGCVPGIIMHHWHGSKRLRFYGGREDINTESHYDPDVDIAYDVHGMPFLCSDNYLLRDGIRRYNSRRNSDCIRVD